MNPRTSTAGMTLLEVLIALVVLSLVGGAVMRELQAAVRVFQLSVKEERRLGAADKLLSATALLSSAELDQRIGQHPDGDFQVRVQRPEPGTYRLSIATNDSTSAELLVTVVYRGDQSR